MEQHLLYYIDQYFRGTFLSRSEPVYDRDICENVLFGLRNALDNSSETTYSISVSMSLEEYERLELKSHRLKIKFVESRYNTSHQTHYSDKNEDNEIDRFNRSLSPTPEPLVDYSSEEEQGSMSNSFVDDSHINDTGYELLETDLSITKEPTLQSKNINNEEYFAYKYKKGYVMKNSKKNRRFMRENCLIDHFYSIFNDTYFYIKKDTISECNIPFLELANIKKKTEKIKLSLGMQV